VKRRGFLRAAAGGIAVAALPARAQQVLPAHDLEPLLRAIAGAAPLQPGRVHIDLPQLAENGNSVPLEIRVDSPMSEADHLRSLHVFAERNPRPLVAAFHFDAFAGRAQLATRIRLAGSQRIVVIAKLSDGSCWSAETAVVVTAGACLDESSL
jgi:sulfur-oxidizing protein SoxY